MVAGLSDQSVPVPVPVSKMKAPRTSGTWSPERSSCCCQVAGALAVRPGGRVVSSSGGGVLVAVGVAVAVAVGEGVG